MIDINTYVQRSRSVPFYPAHYILDTATTMGRLIKHLLDKGHYGKVALDTEWYFDSTKIENPELDRVIITQVDQLRRQGQHPRKILIGGRTYTEFRNYQYSTAAFWRCRVSYPVFDTPESLSTPGRYRQEIAILGLPVTIVPYMEGVLVLDDEMITVPATPSRW